MMTEQSKLHEEILNILTPLYRDVLEIPDLDLTMELSARDVESWDSLNHITLIVEVETLTGLVFTTDELIALENLGDFVKLLVSKGFKPAS